MTISSPGSKRGGDRLAMVMCVRNEARIIEENLRYHHALGVEKAYVYVDMCTDGTEEILATLPWVEVTPYRRSPDITYHEQQDIQGPCAQDALRRAQGQGFDWLMHVDADEFAWGDNPSRELLERGSLKALVGRVDDATEQIRMRCIEAVPLKGKTGSRQWEQCLFQEKHNILCRDVLHPVTNKVVHLRKWMGHKLGKSIVRPGPDIVAVSQHEFALGDPETGAVSRQLVTQDLGLHAHFFLDDAEHWIEKFRKSAWVADTWSTGDKVPFPIQAWKEYSQTCSDEDARSYYEEWIALEEAAAEALLQEGKLTRRTEIRDTVNRVMELAAQE